MFDSEDDFFLNKSLDFLEGDQANIHSSFFISNLDKSETMEEGKKMDQILDFSPKKGPSRRKNYINKMDDFDYATYIDKELKQLNVEHLDSNVKKKLIQKIRNRMSA